MTRPQEKILIRHVELQSETLAIITYDKMQGREFKIQLEHKFKISISKKVGNKCRLKLEYPNKTFFRNIPGSAEII
jgi:hypothetical protein